jgi:hypothetical protein
MDPALRVRRLTFDLWRPAGLRTFGLAMDMLRDGRKAKTMQVRLTVRLRAEVLQAMTFERRASPGSGVLTAGVKAPDTARALDRCEPPAPIP